MESNGEARRVPVQDRSRRRVEAILGAARELVREVGWVDMKVKDIALRADVPIGSVYQYFPNKGAIIVAIAKRYFSVFQEMVNVRLKAANDLNSLRDEFAALLEELFRFTKEDVVFREIWVGTEADREIESVNVEDSRQSALALAERIVELGGASPDDQPIETHCFMIAHLGGAVARMTFSLDSAEAQSLERAFISMALDHLFLDSLPSKA